MHGDGTGEYDRVGFGNGPSGVEVDTRARGGWLFTGRRRCAPVVYGASILPAARVEQHRHLFPPALAAAATLALAAVVRGS